MIRMLLAFGAAMLLGFGALATEGPRMTLSEAESASAIALVESRVADTTAGTRLPWRTEEGAAGTVQFEHLHSASAGPLSICRGCADPCRAFQLRRRAPEPRIGYFGLVCRKSDGQTWEVVAMRGVFRLVARNETRVNSGGQQIDAEAVPEAEPAGPSPSPPSSPASGQ